MAVPFNSVAGFSSTVNYQLPLQAARTSTVRSLHLTSSSTSKKRVKPGFCLLVAKGDSAVTESSNADGSSSVNLPALESSNGDAGIQPEAANGLGSELVDATQPKTSDGSGNAKQTDSSADQKPLIKRSSLTAREKLRAARVLSRYTESKASKPTKGNKLLDVLRESDKGKKRSGLPEAPTNIFDDSKRGMPKPGWTFELPVGFDVFLIAVSFVLISTIMFATTFIVWKVGAIHFNDY